eukprot:Skav233031  [mRNA]  locus=scaffold909:867435:869600:- [translate_table: standard]
MKVLKGDVRQAKEREMTRQLDKFEWKKGTDAKNPEAPGPALEMRSPWLSCWIFVNLKFATKKYQRSSADKAGKEEQLGFEAERVAAYRSQDVRSLEACWKTMEYLMTDAWWKKATWPCSSAVMLHVNP